MPGYVKLPNGNLVCIDNDGFIAVKVEIELSDIIDSSLEEFLDLLSEKATGTELLSNISYAVVGHTGNTLEVTVTGDVSSIEVEDVDAEQLPMLEFEVQVSRVGYGCRTIRLSARTAEEAEDIAADDAGNHTYSEHASDYTCWASQVPAQ